MILQQVTDVVRSEGCCAVVQTSQSLQRRVWYSEMHAYALGAAKEGVHHLASNSSVFHLGYYHPHGAALGSLTNSWTC